MFNSHFSLQKRSGSKEFLGRRGFTLIEIIVSLAVFTFVIMISLSAILSITQAQRKAAALRNLQDNIRFAFEAMTKEIRTGSSFHCGASGNLSLPQDCSGGGISFSFVNALGQGVTYQIISGQMVKATSASSNPVLPCVSSNPCEKMTDVSVNIQRMDFYVNGSAAGDILQPRVTIILEARVNDPRNIGTAAIDLQTTITQGRLDS